MTFVQVSKYYYPYFGGIESVVRSLAEGIQNRERDSRVVAAATRGFGSHETINDVSVARVGSLGEFMSVPVAPTFPLHIRSVAKSATVLHYHLPNPVAVTGHLLARPDVPTIATYHSDIVRQRTALAGYLPILRRFLTSVDRIITTSPRLLEHSEILQEYEEKTTVIPLSVDLDEFGPPDSNPPPQDAPSSDRIVLFVGRLSYYKGVEYLVEAMQSVEAKLVVIGEGPQRESLESKAAKLGVADRVQFLGHVPSDELHAWYDASELFVLPSIAASEAFGVVQLEAMAYGTPVVNTDLPTGVPWVSPDGKTGLTVQPRDADALANAIEILLTDDERRHNYGQAARKRVEETFRRDDRVDDVLQCYQEILSE